MARKIVHQLVDDIDGTVLEVGEGETVHFSLNGISYEIDLTDDNAAELRSALEPYIAAGRRSSTGSAARSGATRKRASTRNPETAAIREWANANGYTVSERGRVPAPVVEAYRAAH
ncbi:histone-like nucleoid-structuring protein Lsr2 [Microbacterium tumbae]